MTNTPDTKGPIKDLTPHSEQTVHDLRHDVDRDDSRSVIERRFDEAEGVLKSAGMENSGPSKPTEVMDSLAQKRLLAQDGEMAKEESETATAETDQDFTTRENTDEKEKQEDKRRLVIGRMRQDIVNMEKKLFRLKIVSVLSVVAAFVIGGKACPKKELVFQEPPSVDYVKQTAHKPITTPKIKVIKEEPIIQSDESSFEYKNDPENNKKMVDLLFKKYRSAKKSNSYFFAFKTLFRLLELDPEKISIRKEVDYFYSQGEIEALKLLRKKLKLEAAENQEFEEMRAYASDKIRKLKVEMESAE